MDIESRKRELDAQIADLQAERDALTKPDASQVERYLAERRRLRVKANTGDPVKDYLADRNRAGSTRSTAVQTSWGGKNEQ